MPWKLNKVQLIFEVFLLELRTRWEARVIVVNPSKISNTLTSERVPTSNHNISKYLDLLENAFLFYKAKQYDIRGKGYLKTNAKYFIVGNGLRRHTIGKKARIMPIA